MDVVSSEKACEGAGGQEAGGEGQQSSEQQPMWEEEDTVCVITTELPVAGGGRETALSSSQGKKACQEEEAVGRAGPHPQAMWDVDLQVSPRFSNKKVRGGRERPALGSLGGQSQTEGGGR